MNFFSMLYKLLIGPLELIFELIYVVAYKVLHNFGLSIIVLSLVMNFLVLPLYRRADAMQEEQRETEKKLKKWVTHIKKSFKGDERFMMLQTYYRQNNYKPTSILKGSVSLLLEIPFFIAAYNFLSHAGVFNGVSFGPLQDLGSPDGLIKIGSLSINLLPILMTAINIISSAIYTKGLPASSKVQLYGMAGIFLVLLYKSPSALVFYWTLNNLFSLVKNVFYKLKNPKFILGILSSVAGIAILFVGLLHSWVSPRQRITVIAVSLLLQLPFIFIILSKYFKLFQKTVVLTKNDKILFYLGVLVLAVLTGILIPSAVINSSPEEFINVVTFESPIKYIVNSALIAFGIFVVWFSIFYFLANDKGKKYIGLFVWILVIISIVNYMVFGNNFGNITPQLTFEKSPNTFIWTKKNYLINLAVLIVVSILGYLLWRKKSEIIKILYISVILGICGMSIYNCININKIITSKLDSMKLNSLNTPKITLSKNNKNVMVIMMDRAINAYIPYIFNEKPEVAKQFEGFTYYPNTVSFGPCTNIGSPALYGGYEYVPEEMNKRDTEPLGDKQNEALRVMPINFVKNGFDVTVFDPTYAGYSWLPDLSIYDDYPSINKYISMGNPLIGNNSQEYENYKSKILNRNLFIYSIMKIIPYFIQKTLYNDGKYTSMDVCHIQQIHGLTKATGTNDIFMKSYTVLENLANLTDISSDKNTFFMMSNDTAHEPCLLQEPEYIPFDNIDNTEYDATHKNRFVLNGRELKMEIASQVTHYHANMAAMIQLGKYFDFLRDNDVYDNTRIIIVADHGFPLHQFDDMIFGDKGNEDVMGYNPLFMVKDFDSKNFTIDMSFMTNADTPTIAFSNLIENPINPATNKVINNDAKYKDELHIFQPQGADAWNTLSNNGNKFKPGLWYSVHDNIFDINNWEYLPNHE